MMLRERNTSFDKQLKLNGLSSDVAKVSQEILAEMFEVNESIEDCDEIDRIEGTLQMLKSEVDSIKTAVTAAFVKKDFSLMATHVHRLKYYAKAVENAEHKRQALAKKAARGHNN